MRLCKATALVFDMILLYQVEAKAGLKLLRVAFLQVLAEEKSQNQGGARFLAEKSLAFREMASVVILVRHLLPSHKLLRCTLSGELLPVVHESRFDGKIRARGTGPSRVPEENEDKLCKAAGPQSHRNSTRSETD